MLIVGGQKGLLDSDVASLRKEEQEGIFYLDLEDEAGPRVVVGVASVYLPSSDSGCFDIHELVIDAG